MYLSAAFPFYHLTNREVIASVKAGERLAQPDYCPSEVYGTVFRLRGLSNEIVIIRLIILQVQDNDRVLE